MEALIFFIDQPLGFSHLEATFKLLKGSGSIRDKKIILLDRSSFSEPDFSKRTIDTVKEWSGALKTFLIEKVKLSDTQASDSLLLESKLASLPEVWDDFLCIVKTVALQSLEDQGTRSLMQFASALATIKHAQDRAQFETVYFLNSEKQMCELLTAKIFDKLNIKQIQSFCDFAIEDCCTGSKVQNKLKPLFFFKSLHDVPEIADLLQNIVFVANQQETIFNLCSFSDLEEKFLIGEIRSLDVQKIVEPYITSFADSAVKGKVLCRDEHF